MISESEKKIGLLNDRYQTLMRLHSGFTAQKIYVVQSQADNTAISIITMFNLTNGTLDEQLMTTDNMINNLHIDADNAATSVVNMFQSTNGTLGEQLSKVRENIQGVIEKANEAPGALKNMGMETPLRYICGIDVAGLKKSIPIYQMEAEKCLGLACLNGIIYLIEKYMDKE